MSQILAAGSVDVAAGLYDVGGPANIVFWLGLVSVIAGLTLQTTSLMWRRDAGLAQLTDSLLDLPVTLLMMFFLPAVGVTILEICDLAAAAVGEHAFANGFGETLDLDVGMPGFMRTAVGILMILVLLVLYVEQLVRGHLATVLIVLGPLAIAMRSWAPARVVLDATVKLFCALALTPLLMMLMVSVALVRYTEVFRLSRRGNRRLNHAIHMAAVTQIRHRHSPGRAYYDRKIAEGHSGKEATRALKRRLSDAIYTRLRHDALQAAPPAMTGPGGHPGNDSVASAAGSHPEHRLFGQATPGPDTTLRPAATDGRSPRPTLITRSVRRAS